jgi:hypothetical protein
VSNLGRHFDGAFIRHINDGVSEIGSRCVFNHFVSLCSGGDVRLVLDENWRLGTVLDDRRDIAPIVEDAWLWWDAAAWEGFRVHGEYKSVALRRARLKAPRREVARVAGRSRFAKQGIITEALLKQIRLLGCRPAGLRSLLTVALFHQKILEGLLDRRPLVQLASPTPLNGFKTAPVATLIPTDDDDLDRYCEGLHYGLDQRFCHGRVWTEDVWFLLIEGVHP